jgi:hypothetical protein
MTWPLANVGYTAGSLSITPNVYSMNELAEIQLPFGYLAIEFSIFFRIRSEKREISQRVR